jgi:hypothetical protein
MPGKGNPFVKFRVTKKYDALLRIDANRKGISVSELARRILSEHYERVWGTQSSGVGHLEKLTHLAKKYVTTVELSRQTTKVPMKGEKSAELPGTPKRHDLEGLAWQAIQEAVTFSKTEDAAKNAKARLMALRVADALMRTELAILRDQDDAFVEALLEELRQDTNGLEKNTQGES